MFIVGYATEEEIALLRERGWEVEDAAKMGRVVGEEAGSMMTPPMTPSPSNTKAVAIFVDASVYETLRERFGDDSPLNLEGRADQLGGPELRPAAVTSDSLGYPIQYVDCCKEFGRYLQELPNDQNADPGYRHIRLEIITPGGAMRGGPRVRFCPWCGTEFKTEDSPGAVREFEVVAVGADKETRGELRLVMRGRAPMNAAEATAELTRRRAALAGGGITTLITQQLGVGDLKVGDVLQVQARLDSRLFTERRRV